MYGRSEVRLYINLLTLAEINGSFPYIASYFSLRTSIGVWNLPFGGGVGAAIILVYWVLNCALVFRL